MDVNINFLKTVLSLHCFGNVLGAKMTKRVFDGERIRADFFRSNNDVLVITFDHWMRGKMGFQECPSHSSIARMGHSHLRLISSKNDWFINSELPAALDVVRPYIDRFRNIFTVSFSMGGYLGLLFSKLFSVSRALFVSPVLGWRGGFPYNDLRFDADDIDFDVKRRVDKVIESRMNLNARSLTIVDQNLKKDLAYAKEICEHFPRSELIYLKGGGHPATRQFSDTFSFGKILDTLFEEDFDGHVLHALAACISRPNIGRSHKSIAS